MRKNYEKEEEDKSDNKSNNRVAKSRTTKTLYYPMKGNLEM